jgi:hypothetical protein
VLVRLSITVMELDINNLREEYIYFGSWLWTLQSFMLGVEGV